ncbi:MAG: hypothetical protein LC135_09465 [Phycisphaerae bacterium]|nr:hypothetical protein [Phycisphaerae bacterium]MCZ2400078.1 hypothetical protein [Phycisphaerae bacterium]
MTTKVPTTAAVAAMVCIAAMLALPPVSQAQAASYHCTCKCKNGSTVSKTIKKADNETDALKKCEKYGKNACAANGGLHKDGCTVSKTNTHETQEHDGDLLNL